MSPLQYLTYVKNDLSGFALITQSFNLIKKKNTFCRCGHSRVDKRERGSAREIVFAVQQIQSRRRGAMCRWKHLPGLQCGERSVLRDRVRRDHGDCASRFGGKDEIHIVDRGR